jgi:cytochrome c oxidase subunit 1
MPTDSDTPEGGARGWLFSLDHKRIALLQLGTLAVLLVVVGALAVAVGISSVLPGGGARAHAPSGLVAAYGIVLTFLVALPAIPLTLGNFALPLMIGARNLAFPGLARAGLWLYWVGAAIAIGGLLVGGQIREAWTFAEVYEPAATGDGLLWTMLGAVLVAIAGLCSAINVIVSVHKLRARGLAFRRLPIFVWAAYGASVIAVVAPAPLALAFLLSVAERTIGLGIFRAKLGGDPLLYQHLFWLYAHPTLVGGLLWALGISGELIGVHARRADFGSAFFAPLFLTAPLLAVGAAGIHLVGDGISGTAATVYSLMALVSLVPLVGLIGNGMRALRGGSIALTAPMVLALALIVSVTLWIGISLPLDVLGAGGWLHGSLFEVATLHYALGAVTLTAFFAGLLHWWPRLTGRLYDAQSARAGAIGFVVASNVTLAAELTLGLRGGPGAPSGVVGIVAAIGSTVVVASLLWLGAVLLRSLWTGKHAPDNPWYATTLDWVPATVAKQE